MVDAPTIIDISKTYGYYNKKNELVLLTNEYAGEEQSWHNRQYYFKDGKVFFIFISEGAHGIDSQERIYLCDSKIIRALIKRRDRDDDRNFSEIENERYDYVMDNVEEQTIKYLKQTQKFIEEFNKGLKD